MGFFKRLFSADYRAAVAAEASEVAAAIRTFNEMPEDDPDFHGAQIELPARFGAWAFAWWTVIQRTEVDGRPAMQEIYELAQVRAADTSMQEIVDNAKRVLDALAETAAAQ